MAAGVTMVATVTRVAIVAMGVYFSGMYWYGV